jgi:hypothetical protein
MFGKCSWSDRWCAGDHRSSTLAPQIERSQFFGGHALLTHLIMFHIQKKEDGPLAINQARDNLLDILRIYLIIRTK